MQIPNTVIITVMSYQEIGDKIVQMTINIYLQKLLAETGQITKSNKNEKPNDTCSSPCSPHPREHMKYQV